MRQIRRHTAALLASALSASSAFAQQPPQQPPRQAPTRPSTSTAPAGAGQQGAARQSAQAGGRRGVQGGPPGSGGPGRRGEGLGGGPAGILLGMKTQLELTDDQVKKLEAMRNAPHPQPNESDMLRARADMMDATQGDGDLVKARAALDKMAKLRTDEQIARLKERQDVRAVLTSAQKTKLDNVRGMRGGMGKGMRGGRPGMGMERGQRMRRGGGPGMGPGMMGPGDMGPGDMGPGGMGPDGMPPGMRGNMRPGGMRPGRGPAIEEDVVIVRRPPAPPADSLGRP